MKDIQEIVNLIEQKRDKWIDISKQIWSFSEKRDLQNIVHLNC